MKKRQRAPKVCVAKTAGAAVTPAGHQLQSLRFGLATLAVLLLSVIGAAATNTIYHGHVVMTHDRTKSPAAGQPEANSKAPSSKADVKSAAGPSVPSPDFIARYGPAAKSQLVAAAIKKMEMAPGGSLSARQAADRSEALQHGYMKPGTSRTEIIMAGYVPPGMPPEQAAILYRALPRTPVMSGPVGPDQIARMAGEPVDPMQLVLAAQCLTPNQISAQNDQMIRQTMRDRFGPIYLPPLHRNPVMVAPSTQLVHAHQGSIREMLDGSGNIVAQYAYDPYGQATKLQGRMDSDFQYAGYYYHAASGLSLNTYRDYSPVLGRWINRDPIEEAGGLNLYQYAGNRPTSVIDPSGLTWYPVATFAPMIGTTPGNLTKGCIDVVNNAVGTVGSRPELAPHTKCWIGPMAYESAKSAKCDGCGVLWGKQGNGNGTNPGPGFNPATSNPFEPGGLFNYFAYYPGVGFAGMNWAAPTNINGTVIQGAANTQQGYIIPNPPGMFSPHADGVPANTEMWCKTCK